MARSKIPAGADAPKVEVTKAREWKTADGLGFEATLRMDGKPLGVAVDDGNGGGVWMREVSDRDALQRLEAWIKTLPPEATEYGPITVTLDYYLDTVVSAFLDERRYKRLCKTQVLIDLGDRVVGIKGPAGGLAAEARRRYPTGIIINERLGVWPSATTPAPVTRRGASKKR